MKTTSHPAGGALLIIGYGNTLRGDDGVGPHVAEAVGAWHLPGVRTLICQQLAPEHSAPVSQAHTVIFVDASVDAPAEVRLRRLTAGQSPHLLAHSADPATILALARDVFGHVPAAWWLTIPAVRLDFCEALSPVAQAGLEEALRRIKTLAESFRQPADNKCDAVANIR